MIRFGIESLQHASSAYIWHSGFAAGDPHISPVDSEEFQRLSQLGRLMSAKRNLQGGLPDFVCAIYYDYTNKAWVLGGLMCDHRYRKKGVGRSVCCLALGKLLVLDNPFGRGERIKTYVVKGNTAPVKIIEAAGFRVRREIFQAERTVLEYELTDRRGLQVLSDWAADWKASLDHSLRNQVMLDLPAGPA